MKQTTIRVRLEEDIAGVCAWPAPAKVTRNRIEYAPSEWDRRAWRVMAGEAAEWGKPIEVRPKEGGCPSAEWMREVSERLVRVCKKRKFKTKVRVAKTFPNGDAEEVAVTVYWDRPVTPPNAETPGRWKLIEHRKGKRHKLAEIDATLECCGDELYCHLPEGDVRPGYDVFPDYGSVLVLPESQATEDVWWEFTFRPGKRRNAA
jgi:hypothetical protein